MSELVKEPNIKFVHDVSSLSRHYYRTVLPLLVFSWLTLLGTLSVVIYQPIFMICGIILSLKIVLPVFAIRFHIEFYQFDRVEYDKHSVTFSCAPNILRRKTWMCQILFQDIAQVRYQNGSFGFVLNDGTAFLLPSNIQCAQDSSELAYQEIIFRIHRFLEERLSTEIPLKGPFQSSKERTVDNVSGNTIIFARPDNFKEINGKAIWDGISEKKRGEMSILFTLYFAIFYVIIVIGTFIFSTSSILWVGTYIQEGSIQSTNEELDVDSSFLGFLAIYLSSLVIVVVYYTIWKWRNRRLDRELGEEVNSRYRFDSETGSRHVENMEEEFEKEGSGAEPPEK